MIKNLSLVLRVAGGFLLTAIWIAVAVVFASLSLMGTLMANDAGTVDSAAQTWMVVLVLGGQILAGAAGLPLGLAVFYGAKRKLLLRIFGVLLGVGVLLVIVGISLFASKLTA